MLARGFIDDGLAITYMVVKGMDRGIYYWMMGRCVRADDMGAHRFRGCGSDGTRIRNRRLYPILVDAVLCFSKELNRDLAWIFE